MTLPFHMPSTIRLSGVGLAACAIATIAAASAQALPLSSFKDQGVDHIFGSYAPRGDCSKEPRVTIDEKGMTFRANGREIKPPRVEYRSDEHPSELQSLMRIPYPLLCFKNKSTTNIKKTIIDSTK